VYKLVFFVPEEAVEEVKSAVFKAGAGGIGHYQECCWQVLGQGQFRPVQGSRPSIGELNKLEFVREYRVEMLCGEQYIAGALAALKQTHPYEEPAYDVTALVEL